MATVVAFHAHPDDEVLLTGGTIARLAAEGHRVIVVVACDGDVQNGPDQGRRLEAKFASLAEPIIGRSRTRDLIGQIGRVDTLSDLRGVMAMCAA